MTYTHDQILEALKVIQNVCSAHADCKACPFSNREYGNCIIEEESPIDWTINTPDSWKALI